MAPSLPSGPLNLGERAEGGGRLEYWIRDGERGEGGGSRSRSRAVSRAASGRVVEA